MLTFFLCNTYYPLEKISNTQRPRWYRWAECDVRAFQKLSFSSLSNLSTSPSLLAIKSIYFLLVSLLFRNSCPQHSKFFLSASSDLPAANSSDFLSQSVEHLAFTLEDFSCSRAHTCLPLLRPNGPVDATTLLVDRTATCASHN